MNERTISNCILSCTAHTHVYIYVEREKLKEKEIAIAASGWKIFGGREKSMLVEGEENLKFLRWLILGVYS